MTPNKPLAPLSAPRPNSPSPLPTLGVNVVLLLPKLLLIMVWYQCGVYLGAAHYKVHHHGVVRSSTGIPCTTTATLDQALRATRHFWQEPPLAHDPQWESLLSSYSTQCDPFPPCPPPSHPSLYHAVITSSDSAPGADGIPYSVWRICPPHNCTGS